MESRPSPTGTGSPCDLLVLGGSGFVGLHAVELAVAAVSSPGAAGILSVARSAHPVPPGARVLAVDSLDGEALSTCFERERPRCVLLLAALSRLGDCERRPALAQALNAVLPDRVAAWCASAGARLVHVSTDLVFGATDPPEGGFREEHPTGPVSVYGASKADGEAAVLERYPAALVVRLPLLYGDSRGRGLGASDSLLAALERGGRPALYTDEWRTPLEVRSAAAALVELCLRPDAPGGRLHVAGPRRVDRHALGLEVLRAAGRDEDEARSLVRATTREASGVAGSRPRDVSLDCARARAFLTTPLPDPTEGLRHVAR